MPHKAVFFNLEQWAADYITKNQALVGAGVEVGFVNQILDKNHPAPDPNFDILGTFVDSVADATVINALPNLKHIATLSTGYDHIDLQTCAMRGITISYVPTYGENTVAEYTFGLILSLSRKICEAEVRVKEEGSFRLDGLRGFDLMGKTLGVLGTGHIGIHVIRIAKGFGMNVVAFDAFPNPALATELGFDYKSIAEVLVQSDIVTTKVSSLTAFNWYINLLSSNGWQILSPFKVGTISALFGINTSTRMTANVRFQATPSFVVVTVSVGLPLKTQ